MADTAAIVDLTVPNNATWQDAFQFAQADANPWDFTNQRFSLEVKGNPNDTAFLLQLRSVDSEIVVDSIANRILHLNVPDTAVRAALKVGDYYYDLIMYDTGTPNVRVVLMRGTVSVTQGVTGD